MLDYIRMFCKWTIFLTFPKQNIYTFSINYMKIRGNPNIARNSKSWAVISRRDRRNVRTRDSLMSRQWPSIADKTTTTSTNKKWLLRLLDRHLWDDGVNWRRGAIWLIPTINSDWFHRKLVIYWSQHLLFNMMQASSLRMCDWWVYKNNILAI